MKSVLSIYEISFGDLAIMEWNASLSVLAIEFMPRARLREQANRAWSLVS
jgi:hypothetical protein